MTSSPAIPGLALDGAEPGPAGNRWAATLARPQHAGPGWMSHGDMVYMSEGGCQMGDAGRDLAVVQFPHPGGEHNPGRSEEMSWNTEAHRRKFLRSPGRYLDRDDVLRSGIVSFWGEWEPQPRVVERYAKAGPEMPRFLHEPFLQRPADLMAGRQNTDPFVFGDAFLYSNCRQFTRTLGPSRMQRLAEGSVVLFGSKLNHRFVLDSLMVIGSDTPYVIGESDEFGNDVTDVFRGATLEPLAAIPKFAGTRAVLYRGLMYRAGRQAIFSFVPADADGRPFTRPTIELMGLVNPANPRAAKITPTTPDQARDVWHNIVGQVRAQGLDLAVFLAEPPIQPGQAVIAEGKGEGCAANEGCAVGRSRGARRRSCR